MKHGSRAGALRGARTVFMLSKIAVRRRPKNPSAALHARRNVPIACSARDLGTGRRGSSSDHHDRTRDAGTGPARNPKRPSDMERGGRDVKFEG